MLIAPTNAAADDADAPTPVSATAPDDYDDGEATKDNS